ATRFATRFGAPLLRRARVDILRTRARISGARGAGSGGSRRPSGIVSRARRGRRGGRSSRSAAADDRRRRRTGARRGRRGGVVVVRRLAFARRGRSTFLVARRVVVILRARATERIRSGIVLAGAHQAH